MNKIKNILIIAGLWIGFASLAFAAPVSSIFRSLIPETTDKYYVGTSTPSTVEWNNGFFKNLNVSGTCIGCGGGGSGSPTGADTQIQFNDNGGFGASSNLIFDKTTGKVGISSSTPWGLLSVEATSTTNPLFVIGDQGTTSALFTVNGNGNVGIATSTPPQVFSVVGQFGVYRSSNQFGIYDANSIPLASISGTLDANGVDGDLALRPASGGGFTTTVTLLPMSKGGNVGIGTTSPGTTFAVSGQSVLGDNATAYGQLTVGSILATTTNATSSFQGLSTTGLSSSNGITITGGNFLSTSNSTSTLANGFNITSGCYAISGSCPEIVSSSLTGILEEAGGLVGTVTVGNGLSYTGTTLTLAIPVSIANGGTNATSQTTNGVAYFDSSKITSGSALVFTGTNFGIATATPGSVLSVVGTAQITGTTTTQALVSTSTALLATDGGKVGIGTTSPNYRLDISNGGFHASSTAFVDEIWHGNFTGTETIDWSASNQHAGVLTANTTFTFNNMNKGGSYRLILHQDSTGGRTVTWPANVRWPRGGFQNASSTPTLSTAPSQFDVFNFIGDNSTSTSLFIGSYVNY